MLINNTMKIILDISPPTLATLTVQGRLEFQDFGVGAPPLVLSVGQIVVWGQFAIGNTTNPYLGAAQVVLNGDRFSGGTVIVDNAIPPLGNKNIVVLGSFSAVGPAINTTWTRLAQTAAAGATQITLSQPVSWVAGQAVALTATNYNSTRELEELTIAAVSADGLVVSFTTPLAYTHFAGVTSPVSHTGAPICIAAAAGLLSRDITISGNQTGAAQVGYGGHISVACITRTPGSTIWGQVDLRYVALQDMGKFGLQYPALGIQYGSFLPFGPLPAPKPASVVNSLVGVSFSRLHNGGIYLTAATDALVLRNSILHNASPYGVFLDKKSTGAVFVGNLLAGLLRDRTRNIAGQTPWAWPQSSFLFAGLPSWLDGNLVAGSYDAAYTFAAPDCADLAQYFGSNEATSARIGVFALSRVASSGTCVGVSGFTVSLAAHVGILTADQRSDFRAEDVVVTDSHIAVSYSFVSALDENHGVLQQATIAATTALSTTVDASVIPACQQNAACMAMTAADVVGSSCGSVFGPTVRRVGWLIPQVTNKGKTCLLGGLAVCSPPNQPERLCALPWEKRYALPDPHIKADWTLTGVTFVGFGGSDCGGRVKAIAHNPTQVGGGAAVATPAVFLPPLFLPPLQIDYSPPGFLSDITWHSSTEEGKFMFEWNSQTDSSCQNGKGW